MAKKRKYPKRPRQSASFQVWKNYEDRCREVDKHNAQLERDKSAKKAIQKRVMSKFRR